MPQSPSPQSPVPYLAAGVHVINGLLAIGARPAPVTVVHEGDRGVEGKVKVQVSLYSTLSNF